jgi:hypothetical protein
MLWWAAVVADVFAIGVCLGLAYLRVFDDV